MFALLVNDNSLIECIVFSYVCLEMCRVVNWNAWTNFDIDRQTSVDQRVLIFGALEVQGIDWPWCPMLGTGLARSLANGHAKDPELLALVIFIV